MTGNHISEVFPSEAARRVRKALTAARIAVDHIDGDPLNNDPANLRFVRMAENRGANAFGRVYDAGTAFATNQTERERIWAQRHAKEKTDD